MGDRLGERGAYRLRHAQVVDEHRIVAGGSKRRDEDDAVVRPQQALQRGGRLWFEQVKLFARERQDRDLLGCQAGTDRATDESAGAENDDAAW